MSVDEIISAIKIALSAAQAAYELGQDAGPFIKNAYDIMNGKTLTADERAELLAKEQALRNRLQAPITDD